MTAKQSIAGAANYLVAVYPLRVEAELDIWPERLERKRAWFDIDAACDCIAREQRHVLQSFEARLAA